MIKDTALKGWMIPRYVVLSSELPREIVRDALDLKEADQSKMPRMKDMAQRMDISLDELTIKVQKAAEAYTKTAK